MTFSVAVISQDGWAELSLVLGSLCANKEWKKEKIIINTEKKGVNYSFVFRYVMPDKRVKQLSSYYKEGFFS